MFIRRSALVVASPIVFLATSVTAFNATPANVGMYGAPASVGSHQMADSGQQPQPKKDSGQQPPPKKDSGQQPPPKNTPGGKGGNPSFSRWEGMVVRVNKDKSTLTVRRRGMSVEKTVEYDSSTKFTSQEHGSKKVNDIDAGQINDNDRVIVLGTLDENGVLHATLISKRLTP
jgi:hypothetical protein